MGKVFVKGAAFPSKNKILQFRLYISLSGKQMLARYRVEGSRTAKTRNRNKAGGFEDIASLYMLLGFKGADSFV